MVVPAAIADAGETAKRRFLEFFAATIRNRNTRMAYYRAVRHFFAWSDTTNSAASTTSSRCTSWPSRPARAGHRSLDRLYYARHGQCRVA